MNLTFSEQSYESFNREAATWQISHCQVCKGAVLPRQTSSSILTRWKDKGRLADPAAMVGKLVKIEG